MNYVLRVIFSHPETLVLTCFDIVSDIPSGSKFSLTFYLTFYTFFLAYTLTLFYQFYLTFGLASILTVYLAGIPAIKRGRKILSVRRVRWSSHVFWGSPYIGLTLALYIVGNGR